MKFPFILGSLSLLNIARKVELLEVLNSNENLVTIDSKNIPTFVVENHEDHLKVLPPITVAPVIASTLAITEFTTPTITMSGVAYQRMKTKKKKQKKKKIIEELEFDAEQYLKEKINGSKVIKESTQVFNQMKSTARVKVASTVNSNLDKDISDIWHKLESNDLKGKKKQKKEKKQKACKLRRHIENKQHKKKQHCRIKKKPKKDTETVTPKCHRHPKATHKPPQFHTLPAKKKRSGCGCLMEQTVIIPQIPISFSSIPAPVSSIISNRIDSIKERISSRIEKVVYNCITNFAGTHTATVTQTSFIPVPTTNTLVSTSTIFAPTTQKIFEVLYTPFTVTKTTTDTMYMIKVTTACKAGCNACELDANGMVLPAGQLPPGIFATPINEVDRSQYDIVGYAGMNLSCFKAELHGYQSTTI